MRAAEYVLNCKKNETLLYSSCLQIPTKAYIEYDL